MSPWATGLALAVFAMVWAGLPGVASSRLDRAGVAPVADRVGGIGADAGRQLLISAVVVGSVCWLLTGGGIVVAAVAAGAVTVAALARRVSRNWSGRKQRRERQLAVIELCDSLSAEMRGGLPADRAVSRACGHRAEWQALVTTAQLGGDVAEALRAAAVLPGADGLRAVAASWQVATRSGAGLAVVLERTAAGLRTDDEARSEVVASLGPPRATAKMLAVLPVFGLALGSSMGARPVDFLLHTGAGLACLLVGVTLAGLGVAWVEKLASSAEV
jgi:tight adherence protein B